MENVTHGAWKELKGEIQKKWGQLTGDELEETKGNLSSIAGLLERKYGVVKKDAEMELARMRAFFQKKKDQVRDGIVDATDRSPEETH